MGYVADKIAQRFLSPRNSKVVDLASWREGKKMAFEAGLSDDGQALEKYEKYDPCHAVYIIAQNIASILAEFISEMREAEGYVKIAGDAEDEYLPSGPPMSPLTVSYFTMWAMFDVEFGSSRETIGRCILRMAAELDCPPWLIDAIERMQQSRMGFYVHCGSVGEDVLLREVGTRELVSCLVPAGYVGRVGQIWFARVLSPPDSRCQHHIVFTTPYVIRGYSERDFVAYLERELARMKAKRKRPWADDAHEHLMKYGPDPNHWNEYIFCAYSNYQYEAIFLSGIPDIRESLPHASIGR